MKRAHNDNNDDNEQERTVQNQNYNNRVVANNN